MFAFFRRIPKFVVTGVFVLLMLSFLVLGRNSIDLRGIGGDNVVEAGRRKVTAQQFSAMFDRYLQGLSQQNGGQPVPRQQAIAQGLDTRALNEVAYEESVGALATRLGVRPSDQLVGDELGKAQRFRDPVTGRFDKKAYTAFLREQNISAEELEGSIRDQIAQQHLLTGLVAGLQAPFAYTALQAAYNGETRSFSYIALTPNLVPTPPKPTDAELQKFITDNAQAFRKPEVRTVSLVRFSASQLAPTVTVDPAEVQKRFDFEKDSLSTPEKRTLVEVPLKSADQSAAVVARLQKGEDPNAVAKSVGTQALTLSDTPATAIPDHAVADAAFAMKPGEVRGVTGGLGPAVVKLVAVTPGKAVTLDDVRAKVEDEARRGAAAAKASQAAKVFDDARNGGANFQAAAAKAGVTITPLPAFTAKGLDAHGQHIPAPEKLVQTADQLQATGDSDVAQAAPGEYYAIHVDKIEPPALVSLEEVRAPLTQQMTLKALAKALQAKADALVAQAKKDGNLDGAAKAAGVAVQHAVDTPRVPAPSPTGQPQPGAFGGPLLGAVFGAKPGGVVSAPEKLSIVVAKVEGVKSAPTPQLVQTSAGLRGQATFGLYDDLGSHLREAARAEIKPKVDVKRAKKVVGASDDAPAAPGG